MVAHLRRESGLMTCEIPDMDMYEKEQELRAVFTTEPEPEADPEQDRATRYSRRSRFARWGVRLTIVVLVSMMSTALLSDPRIREYINDGIAVWKNEAQAVVPFLSSEKTSQASSASEDQVGATVPAADPSSQSRPPVSVLPSSVVPVRRAGG